MAKILVLAFDMVPSVDAVGQHLSQLIPALAERAEVDAMTLKGDELAHIQRFGAARLMRVPTAEKAPAERVAAFQRAVARQIDNEPYDVVYCADLFAASTAASASSLGSALLFVDLFDLPSISFGEQNPGIDDRRWHQSLRRHEMAALMAASRVVVHSETMRRYLLGLNVPPERVRSLPFGVATDIFTPPSIEVRADPSACLIAALVAPWRDAALDELARVLAQLPKRVHLQLLTSAPVPVADTLEQVAAQHGVSRRLSLECASTTEQMARALGNVDVALVQWSWSDKVLETGVIAVEALNAMSCGRPVVTTEAPGNREFIEKGDLGHCVRRGDGEGLVKYLTELVTSSALRKRLGTRGREFVLDHYSWERLRPRYLELVEDALGARLGQAVTDPRQSETTPADRAIDTPPVTAPGEGQHTPVMARPTAADGANRSAAEAPAKGGSAVPAPIALGVSDQLDSAAGANDPWVHDTIAMSTQPDVLNAMQAENAPVAAPGLRSLALMDSVGPENGSEDKTEVRPHNLSPSDETERLEISESLVKRLYGPRSTPHVPVEDEETIRLPAFPGDQAVAPRAAPAPLRSPATAPRPSVVEIGPGEFVGAPLGVDETTDLDRETKGAAARSEKISPARGTVAPADGDKTSR